MAGRSTSKDTMSPGGIEPWSTGLASWTKGKNLRDWWRRQPLKKRRRKAKEMAKEEIEHE